MAATARSASASTRRRIRHIETDLQQAAVTYFDRAVTDGRAFLFAVPNGEARDGLTAGILKGMGVRAGVFDLVLTAPALVVFIETKRPATQVVDLKTERLRRVPAGSYSASQLAFKARMEGYGFPCRSYTSIDEFIAILAEFGVVRRYANGAAP